MSQDFSTYEPGMNNGQSGDFGFHFPILLQLFLDVLIMQWLSMLLAQIQPYPCLLDMFLAGVDIYPRLTSAETEYSTQHSLNVNNAFVQIANSHGQYCCKCPRRNPPNEIIYCFHVSNYHNEAK